MIYFFDNDLNMIKVATSKNVISAVHEHELNGLILGTVETDLSYTEAFINDVDYFGYYYKDNYHLHKIKRVEHEHENELVRIIGRHIFFEDMLYGDYIRDIRPVNRDALYILNQTISANTRWQTVMTDTSKLHSETYYWVPPMEVLNDLTENVSIEYEPRILFDGQNINGFQLHVANRIGEDKPIRVPFGSRVLNLKYEVDYSEIVTALYGHGKGEEVGDGYGRRINFRDIVFRRNGVVSPVGQLYMENPNVTDQYGKDDGSPKFGRIIFEDIESASQLAIATYEAYLEQSRPKMLFEASVVDLGDVGMGDGVLIIRREYDVYFNARIHKLMVDLLDEKNADVELGDYAHFKESKVQRKTRENNNQYRRETSSRIQQLKEQFNERFDGEVNQMREDFEQALIDANANIQAAEERMQTLIESERNTMMDEFNEGVQEARNYAEQQAQAKADAVQSNLESFEQTHQQLYDSVTFDIMDIDDFLGDKSTTLAQQFADVESDFSGLQTELNGVSEDLGVAKTNLQQQLNDAKAELEGIEVGTRNLIPDSHFYSGSNNSWSNIYGTHVVEEHIWKKTYTRESGAARIERPFQDLEVGQTYTLTMYMKTDADINWSGFVAAELIKSSDTTATEEYKIYSVTFKVTSEETVIIRGYQRSVKVGSYTHMDWFTLVKGTMPTTDWTPAPEDTEQKITTLNEQIEYIDGQLSAKLEQTDIEPINNKITEYGNTLTANAQSIQSLLDKTELLDGDITQWSNETKANAESISQTLTRVEETEDGISQAQTDIQTNADGIAGVIRDVETIDGNLSTLTTDFNVEAGKIETLISKTDGHDTQLTNIIADYNSIEQTVAANDDWLGTHGSNVLQTVDGFEQKVWLSDMAEINPNLIPFADTSHKDNINRWSSVWGDSAHIDDIGEYNVENNSSHQRIGVRSSPFELVQGRTYTFSVIVRTSNEWNTQPWFNYTFLMRKSDNNTSLGSADRDISIDPSRRLKVWTFTANRTEDVEVMFATNTINQGQFARFSFKEPKLEEGTERTLFMNAFSNIEQKANELILKVQELTSNVDGEHILTESDITVSADRVLIGSTSIGAIDMASILSVSPSAIDMITDELNLTGNLNVKGQIETISMEAVEGEFARLWAAEFKAIAIDVNDIHGVTAHFEYLYTLNANIEKLVSQTAFINEINTLSLNAVYGDISDLRTELLTSNVILSRHVNSSMALIDKIFSEEAYIERLTSKSAFIRDIQAIEITANQLNLTTLTNRINEIEGGLRIKRPDGVDWVRNGQARGHVPVQVSDGYAGANIRFNGTNFITGSSTYQTMKYFYTPHEGTRLRVVFAVGLFSGSSSVEFMHVRVRGFSGYNPINMGSGSRTQRVRVISGETNYVTLDIPMAPPNYAEFAAYLEFRRDPDGQYYDNEVYARLLHIGQYE